MAAVTQKKKIDHLRDWTREYFVYIEVSKPTSAQVGQALRFMMDSSIKEIIKDSEDMRRGFGRTGE